MLLSLHFIHTTVKLFKSSSRSCSSKMAVPWLPCQVGATLAEIDTPALVIDLDPVERNLTALVDAMKSYPNVKVRVHGKAHKCPALALKQMEHGSSGICCQVLTEAEAMVNGGVKDILVSNQIIGKKKLRRLISLCKRASVSLCVDSQTNVEDINDIAGEFGQTLALVVEINVGQNRCGVEPGEAVAELADLITNLPNVTFKGIQCYQGKNQHVRKPEDRRNNVLEVVEKVKDSIKALSARSIACDYVTGGGTGSFRYEAESGVFTEVQPGSYVLMDVDYGRNLGQSSFEHSLYIISTVQSVTAGERAVVDVGLKGLSVDSGMPLVANDNKKEYICGGDEHGIISPPGDLKVGDQVRLIPGHCDPTVNLYDWLIGLRNGCVESIWPITGRGPGV